MSFFNLDFLDPTKLALLAAAAATGGATAPALLGTEAAAGTAAGTIGALGAATPASVSAGLLSPEIAAMQAGVGGGTLGSTSSGLGLLGAEEVGKYGAGAMAAPETFALGEAASAPMGFFDGDTAGALANGNPLEANLRNGWNTAKEGINKANEVMKPVGQVISAVDTANKLFPNQKPNLPPLPQAVMPQVNGGGAQTMQSLAQTQGMIGPQIEQMAQQRKQRRYGLLG